MDNNYNKLKGAALRFARVVGYGGAAGALTAAINSQSMLEADLEGTPFLVVAILLNGALVALDKVIRASRAEG